MGPYIRLRPLMDAGSKRCAWRLRMSKALGSDHGHAGDHRRGAAHGRASRVPERVSGWKKMMRDAKITQLYEGTTQIHAAGPRLEVVKQ